MSRTGRPRLDPNRPCVRGHVDRNASGACRPCRAEQSKRWKATPHGKRVTSAQRSGKGYSWASRLRKLGLTPEAADKMLAAQQGTCAIPNCGERISRENGTAHLDHCHITGRPRAFLCPRCNKALGLLRESPARARGVATYVEAWREFANLQGAWPSKNTP